VKLISISFLATWTEFGFLSPLRPSSTYSAFELRPSSPFLFLFGKEKASPLPGS
jgi:hypothetical protein